MLDPDDRKPQPTEGEKVIREGPKLPQPTDGEDKQANDLTK